MKKNLTLLSAVLGLSIVGQGQVVPASVPYATRVAAELLANSFIGYSYTGTFTNRTDVIASTYRTMLALEALASASSFTMASANITNLTTHGMVLYTNTFWDDSQVPGLSFRVGGTAPTLGNFTDANIQCYRFTDAQDDTVYGSIQLSHRYKAGTTLKPHIHIAPLVAGTTNTVWWMYYSITNINSAFPASTLVKITNNLSGVAQYAHKIVSLGDIPNSAGKGSDVMLLTIIRKGTDAEDKDPSDVALLSFDLHFEVDKPGSDNETP